MGFNSKYTGIQVETILDALHGISYDPITHSFVFEGNLIVTGGGAFRAALGDLDVPTIMDAIITDEDTISKEGGILKVLKAGLDPTELEGYLEPYIKEVDVKNTYATKTSVNALSIKFDNFLTGSDTDTIINKWKELEVFLSGLSESDSLSTLLSNKANKSTTLAGYGITNAYTKSEINNIIDSLDNTYVTIAGAEQRITAEHNFVNGFKVGGLPVYKSKDNVLFIDASIVVRGGITSWGDNNQTAPTIWDGLPIDNATIKRDANGLFYAEVQDSEGINESQLKEYLTTNGYATQSWVTGKGYLTGITGTMVTNALGYTPFNNASFTTATIKSTLGISDWALASAKPSYSYSEISGTPTSLKNPYALSWSGYSSGSYDGSSSQSITIPNNTNQLTNGAGFITASASITGNAATATLASTLGGGHPSGASNKLSYLSGQFAPNTTPTAGQIYIGSSEVWGVISAPKLDGNTSSANAMSLRMGFNSKFWHEIAATPNNNNLYHRNVRNGVGNSWSTILNSSNYSAYALPITGGTVNGDISLPNGNMLISPSGNIAGTRIFGDDTTNYRTILGTASLNTLLIGNSTLKFWKGTVSKEYEIIDTSMPSISFPRYIATGIGTTEQSGYKVTGNGVDVTFGANDATGGAYIWVASNHALRLGTNGAERVRITAEGLVGIGNTNPVARLDVGGTILTTADLATTEWVSDRGQIRANCKGTSYWIGIGATSTGQAVIQGGNRGVGSIPLLLNPTAGNVAIGGTTASEKLHVYGNILATGAANVGSLSVGSLTAITNYQNAALVIGSSGATTYINGATQYIRYGDTLQYYAQFKNNGDIFFPYGWIGIGTTVPSEKLTVEGNILATGGITARYTSDERLKTNLRPINASQMILSLGRVREFEYIDSEIKRNSLYKGSHIGLIYQDVKGSALSKMCFEREDGFGSINYLEPSFISLIVGTCQENTLEIEKLKKENIKLKNRIKQLENIM